MSGSTIEQTFLASTQKDSAPINRAEFEKEVYMTIEEAVHELSKRENDRELDKKINDYLGEIGKPEILSNDSKNVVIFRQIATPNFEISRFLIAADSLGLNPVFFEYLQDKFVPKNEMKKFYGKIPFHFGFGKNSTEIIGYKNIINFVPEDGKPLNLIKTVWGETLVDFHHNLFKTNYSHTNEQMFYDASSWLKKSGGNAEKYYPPFLSLFIKNNILFENFMLEDKEEKDFIEKVFLPSFRSIKNIFGVRPIIVALEPTDIEGNLFWHCHNTKSYELVKNQLSQYN
ncbi:MAG: hypothetical protein QG585_496 [Patescibacteria group bacterium]|jgi:hypothetical protein|nr:hypothetical protein [Patescibacteria group bacterium]